MESLMPLKHLPNKIKLAELPDGVCNINPASYHEIFISSSKLVSIYNEKVWHPSTDIFETDKEIVVRSEIGGMKPEEITVRIDGNRLIISGCRDERDARVKRTFRQMEIEYGKFERVLEFNCGIEMDKATATYMNGFLEIVLTKSKKQSHPTKLSEVITIKQITFY
jgi:HSP20 family protein